MKKLLTKPTQLGATLQPKIAYFSVVTVGSRSSNSCTGMTGTFPLNDPVKKVHSHTRTCTQYVI